MDYVKDLSINWATIKNFSNKENDSFYLKMHNNGTQLA